MIFFFLIFTQSIAMERLPKELYASISSHLTQGEKIECLLVSRHWYKMMKESGVLFSRLLFLNDSTKLEDAIKYFQKHPDMSYQINEAVYCNKCAPSQELLVQLPILFANLKNLKFWIQAGIACCLPDAHSFIPNAQKNWSSALRSLTEVYICNTPLTSFIVDVPCPYLTSLSLQYYEPHYQNNLWESHDKGTKDKLIGNLNNTSNLESLTLQGVHLTMHDFELIHQRLPKLKKLVLRDFTFRLNDTHNYPYENTQQVLNSDDAIIIRNPEHAPLLEHLEILMFYDNSLEFQDENITYEWLKYISKKYSGLRHFTLSFVTVDLQHTMYDKQLSEELVLPIIQSNPNLKTFEYAFAPISVNMLHLMDANGTRLQSIVVPTYLDHLGPQLNALTQSKQKNSIDTVKIIIRDDIDSDADSQVVTYAGRDTQLILDKYCQFITNPLRQCTRLRHLNVRGDWKSICITWLQSFLKEFRQLESISFYNVLYVESFGDQPFVESRVRHIHLDEIVFPSIFEVESFCKQSCQMFGLCPDLEIFSIESSYYEYDDKENTTGRKVALKLDFRQNKKLKRINLHFRLRDRYVCIYRNNESNYTLYQTQCVGKERFIKIGEELPEVKCYVALYLNDTPVYINNKLIR